MDFQIGTVKRTQGQVKKHASQCSIKELDQLENALNRVQDGRRSKFIQRFERPSTRYYFEV